MSVRPEPEVGLAVALGVLVIAAHLNVRQPFPGLVFDLATCAALALVGRFPRFGAGLMSAALLGAAATPPDWYTLGGFLTIPLIASLGIRGHERLRLGTTALVYPILVADSLRDPRVTNVPLYLLLWAVLLGLGWVFGSWFGRQRTELLRAEESRRKQTRSALARQLHDSLAHELTQINWLAREAGERGADAAALKGIEEASARAVADLRDLLTLLNSPDDLPTTPFVPLTRAVERERTRLQDAGFQVQVTAEPGPPLPAEVEAALDRVLREASNNVLKHGDPNAPCALLVSATDDAIELAMFNGLAAKPRPRDHEPLGLAGLHQHITALGGSWESVPSDGRWITHVRLPIAVRPRQERS